ncbi:Ioc2p PWA37_001356 [Arxiozyma heterogenica]|uniref:Ioc2p n=1 Tax=Arxiozyma heterogenica TaxID=278026 RepID=UPI002EDCA5BA
MKRTRRSTRISYAEPSLDLDDLIPENEVSSMRTTRRSTRSTRHSRELNKLEIQKKELEIEQLEFVKPQKKLKVDIKPLFKDFDWKNYVSEDTLRHVEKTVLPDFPNDSKNQISDLIKTWYYHYVMSWLNNVCDSYVTTILNSVKPFWKDIKFDEILFLQDFCSFNQLDGNTIELNDDNLSSNNNNSSLTKNLVELIKLRLLRLLTNSRSHTLNEWDSIIKEQLKIYYPAHDVIDLNLKFHDLPFIEQFKCYYYIIKIIENKSMTFKNYLNSHLDLFQFSSIKNDKSENSRIVVLPTHGSIVEVKTTFSDDSDSGSSNKLRVPIKLKNCTIIKENKANNEKELIHLDYSNEIDSYLQSIKIQYNVLSWDWPSFIEYVKMNPSEFLTDFIEIKMAHLLYSSKLLAQREKAKSISLLMVNRKRSSRLVAREEEAKRKEISNTIQDKLDDRMYFLKNRHRSLSKYNKKLKDIIWNILWYKFDQDFRLIKIRDKSIQKFIKDDEKLTETDIRIINNGAYFTQSIIDIDDESMYIHDTCNNDPEHLIQEIPSSLCIDSTDIKLATENGIDLNSINKPDVKDWIFHCICDNSIFKQVHTEMDDYKEEIMNNDLIYNHKLICCDLCNIWEHWDCQPQENIDYLAQMHAPIPKKGGDIPKIKQLTEKDFSIVVLGKLTGENYSELNQRKLRKRVEYDGGNYDDDDDDYVQRGDGADNRRTYRRSTRLASLEQVQKNEDNDVSGVQNDNDNDTNSLRPADLRPRYGQTSPYICGFCMRHWEKELRSVFIPELEIIRVKQRKGHDDRERRKQKKLEKQRLEEMTKSNTDHNNNNNNNNNMRPTNSSMNGQEKEEVQRITTNTDTGLTTNVISNGESISSLKTAITPQRTLDISTDPIVSITNTNTTTISTSRIIPTMPE